MSRKSPGKDVLLIDWISPPNHKNFNRSFFSALGIEGYDFHVFDVSLILGNQRTELHKGAGTRFFRFIKVLHIIFFSAKKKVFLLTYDPIFLPILTFSGKEIIVFEHNTVPDKGINKHALFQRFFFPKSVLRVCQYASQVERIRDLGGFSCLLGSPLRFMQRYNRGDWGDDLLLVAPSARERLVAILDFADMLTGSTIIAKKASDALNASLEPKLSGRNIELVLKNRVEISVNGGAVDAVLITVSSDLRGSGWFNDAIGLGVPIVISCNKTRNLFEAEFPDYPFVFVADVADKSDLVEQLADIKNFDNEAYINAHNNCFRSRYENLMG